MKNELSILIPCYNCRCGKLVNMLHALLKKEEERHGCEAFRYEIIVADDGSTDTASIEENKHINSLDNCRYVIREKNTGRSAIRNFLAREAKYKWLLFMDSDMAVRNGNYIARYISSDDSHVVYGGYSINGDSGKLKGNLRFAYEKRCEAKHTCTERGKHPYKDFHTSNFLVRRDIMLTHPLDERFRHYGYEDVLWGKTLKDNNVKIMHLDNPLSFEKFENNSNFISKTEEGLTTLHCFSKELEGYSDIIRHTNTLRKLKLIPLMASAHNMLSKHIKSNLQGNNPSLKLFFIYKILFFCNLLNNSDL